MWQAYGKALELDPKRLYSLVQSGTIQLALGAYSDSLASAEAALQLEPAHVPARTCAAAALLASARRHIAMGAPGKCNLFQLSVDVCLLMTALWLL